MLVLLGNKKSNCRFSLFFFSISQPFSIPVLILSVGVELSLTFDVSIQLNFPVDQNSLNPVNLTVEVSAPLRGLSSPPRDPLIYCSLQTLLL